ncbi:hypothetical protein DCC81_11900 [Chitinophaga parva]|uniref:Uncharacterized protein n=1 Tax=Chitinophaga parva TaxID=2169414 RepID=A0A2T7BFE9_9BACT|nr:hypothetical protein [Chitinophaga parva]PUZ25010.1 hypothetical protein DCC81_11900 [Chitinophaga parva]
MAEVNAKNITISIAQLVVIVGYVATSIWQLATINAKVSGLVDDRVKQAEVQKTTDGKIQKNTDDIQEVQVSQADLRSRVTTLEQTVQKIEDKK